MFSMGIPDVHPSLFELSNGLTIIVAEQHSAPVASIQAFCQTGSIHEGEWLGAGLTHLLEHVLFNGTERRTSKQISDEIHGIGGYVNAYTSFDRTVFWVDCPAAAVRQSIDILGAFSNASFSRRMKSRSIVAASSACVAALRISGTKRPSSLVMTSCLKRK